MVDAALQIFGFVASPREESFLAGSQHILPQTDSAVAPLAEGGFVAVWTDWPSGLQPDSSGRSVKAQAHTATGEPVGAQFLVNTETMLDQASRALTVLGNGNFVFSWYDDNVVEKRI
jgi:hypothetical protein